jgi:hypothetical protein
MRKFLTKTYECFDKKKFYWLIRPNPNEHACSLNDEELDELVAEIQELRKAQAVMKSYEEK